MRGPAAITINDQDLQLRFPRGDFTDTYVDGLVASRRGSTAGDVRVYPWSEARVARWVVEKALYERVGRRVVRAIARLGRDPRGDGLVQRLLARVGVPLRDPPRAPVTVANCTIDGRGWL